jgi:DNA-binding transcriptional MerR regulator
MSVSQYAKHAGMSRQALYNWESHEGFPARVDGKIDQEACDAYLARYRDSHDPRTKNAKSKAAPGGQVAGSALVEMSVAEIKRIMASGVTKVAGMDPDERAQVAAKAVELFVSEGPYNPPVTFGGYRLSIVETPDDEIGQIIAGGAFGLSAYDVIYECRDYTLTLMSDETEETAMRRVIPSLLYALADDTD